MIASYGDSPVPGSSYVTLLVIMMIVAVAMPIIMRWVLKLHGTPMAILAVVFALVLILQGFLLHTAFSMQYTIEGGSLHLRGGRLFSYSVPLADIQSVTRMPFIKRVLGHGLRNRGMANRFQNGVKLDCKGLDVYVSPSDVDGFIKAVETAKASR